MIHSSAGAPDIRSWAMYQKQLPVSSSDTMVEYQSSHGVSQGFGSSSNRQSGCVCGSGVCSCSACPVLTYKYGFCRAVSWAIALTAAYTHDE